MLKIDIPSSEYYDESSERFVTYPEKTLFLEHSLVALSHWEAEFEKPFLGTTQHTREETFGYIRAMSIEEVLSDEDLTSLGQEQFDQITDYISAKKSATFFIEIPGQSRKSRSQIVTSELIYYWMVAYNVPFDAQYWHLNRLISVLRIADESQRPKKKMSAQEVNARNAQLNAQRLAQSKSTG